MALVPMVAQLEGVVADEFSTVAKLAAVAISCSTLLLSEPCSHLKASVVSSFKAFEEVSKAVELSQSR